MQNEPIRVLIVNGDPQRDDELSDILTAPDFEVRVVSDSVSARGTVEIWRPSVAVVDLRRPSSEARRFSMDVAAQSDNSLPIVFVGEGPNLMKETAVVPSGLVPTPIDPGQLVATVLRVARGDRAAQGAPLVSR